MKFTTLKKILFGECHTLFKTGWISNIAGNAVLIISGVINLKRKMLLFYLFLWNLILMLLQVIQLIGWWEIWTVVHHLLFPKTTFLSSLSMHCSSHFSANYFLCIFECTPPVIIFLVDHNTWMLACLVSAREKTQPLHVPMCCCSGSAASTLHWVFSGTEDFAT